MGLIQNKQLGDLTAIGRTEAGVNAKTVIIPPSPAQTGYGDIQINSSNVASAWHGISFYQPWNTTGSAWTLMCNSNASGFLNFMGWIKVTGSDWQWYCQNGTFYTKATGTISDAREKENINPLPSIIEKFLQLRPVTYSWIDKSRNKNSLSIGLIAQEVKEIFPDIVIKGGDPFKSDDEQLFSIDTLQLGTVAIAAIQELSAQIKELQDRILFLENNALI